MSLPKPNLGLIAEKDVEQMKGGSSVTAEAISSGPENLASGRDGSGGGPLTAPEDAGHVIPKRVFDKALADLEIQLAATKWLPGPEGSAGKWVEVPDFQVRQRAIELVFAYRHGKPVERTVKLTGNFASYDDKLEKLLTTNEGIEAAIRLGLVTAEEVRVRRSAKMPQDVEEKQLAPVSISRKTSKTKSAEMRQDSSR